MGTLLLCFGQCGNQIGFEFTNYLSNKLQNELDGFYKEKKGFANAILVDTEPKVVKPVKEFREQYMQLNPENVVYCQSGRGNNWAQGYVDKTAFEYLCRRQAGFAKMRQGGGAESSREYIRELIKKNSGLEQLRKGIIQLKSTKAAQIEKKKGPGESQTQKGGNWGDMSASVKKKVEIEKGAQESALEAREMGYLSENTVTLP